MHISCKTCCLVCDLSAGKKSLALTVSFSVMVRRRPIRNLMAGAETSEVKRAMMTRATNMVSRIRPSCSASRPRIISMAPRAFMARPTPQEVRRSMPPRRAPIPAPRSLPMQATPMTVAVMGRLKLATKLVRRPMLAKKKGAKTLVTMPWMSAQVRGFADGDADDEGAEDGVNAGVFCEGGRAQSEREDEAEDAAGPAGVRLDVRQELVDQPADYGEGEHHEGDDQQDGAFHAVHGCAGAVHHAQDHREQDPADEVVEHGG